MKIIYTITYAFWIVVGFFLTAASVFAQGLKNPLSGIKNFEEFVSELLRAVIFIGFPIVVLFIVYSGFLFITAQGDVEKIKTAKNTFLYTIIGVAIFLGSLTLAKIIEGTIKLIT